MILSGISAPVPQVQSIVVKLLLYRDVIFPPDGGIPIKTGDFEKVVLEKESEENPNPRVLVWKEKRAEDKVKNEFDDEIKPDCLAYKVNGYYYATGYLDENEKLSHDEEMRKNIEKLIIFNGDDVLQEDLEIHDETEQFKKENIKVIDDEGGKRPDGIMDLNYEYIDYGCYFASFKVYRNTTFEDLKLACCDYWGLVHTPEWILTDEYFNVLTAYKDTVQNFFEPREDYQPLTQE